MKLSILALVLILVCPAASRYDPNWKSLDSRPLPQWYDDAKFGIFLHWGVYSVPSYRGAWFWESWQASHDKDIIEFMRKNYRPDFTYADFAEEFTAEFYNPDQWADIFKAAGARYVVLTSKHHKGFCNWPTKVSFNWNSMDVGPKRDLVGDLAAALRVKSIHVGLYHSLFEFFHPLFLQDKANNYATQDFVRIKTLPELYELVNWYKPDVIWSDGDWMVQDTYWNSTQFLAWLYNDSPVKDTVVTNDRWGNTTTCLHGGFFTCTDRYTPKVLVKHKFENANTMDKSYWAFRRDITLSDVHTMDELTEMLITTVSCGGNLLLNVGPTKDGRIVPIFEERLRQMGQWLGVNGEAIYETKPWRYQNDTYNPNVWYTSKKSANGTAVYALLLEWPDSDLLLQSPVTTSYTKVTLLGYNGDLKWKTKSPTGMAILIPTIPFNKMPCEWAWTFKLENLMNQ
ncbi:hypothetical protein ACJMK2_035355 [Sinanodonta woodiana]|uniref:alpha-L-fucosidase n=1 Tax=Sinanodonta woodiana TaxID=1069815 RepID=A0ABD3WY71_SINWO